MMEKLRAPPVWWIALLAILSIFPLFSVQIAPLTDWPTHLSIASLAYQLDQNPALNANLYVDHSFWGYSLIYGMLETLRGIMPLSLAGQLVLALTLLLVPAGWWYFFKTLAPEKTPWAAAGLLLSYSTYFYYGNISYLISVPFGLAYLAVGIRGLREDRETPWRLAAFGLLTFLAHAYVFFLLTALLLALGAYHKIHLTQKGRAYTLPLLFILLVSGGIHTALNPIQTFDQSYSNRVTQCAMTAIQSTTYNPNQAGKEIALNLISIVQRVSEPFYSLAFFFELAIAGALWTIAYGLHLLSRYAQDGKPLKHLHAEQRPGWRLEMDPYYLALAGLMILHALIMPECAAWLCNLGGRSLPFAAAFALLAIKPKEWIAPLAWVMLLWAAINIPAQYAIFAQGAAAQAPIAAQMDEMAQHLPPNATVMVIPSAYTAQYNWTLRPPYSNPYYPVLIVDKRPDLYVAGLYTAQQTNPIRSRLKIFDEMAHFGPHPSMLPNETTQCYYPVPAAYTQVIDEKMRLRRNEGNLTMER